MKKEKIKNESEVENIIIKLVIDIIDDVKRDIEGTDYLGLICGLEVIAGVCEALKQGNIELITAVETTYRNNDIYELHNYFTNHHIIG